MFTVEERDRVRQRLVEMAKGDSRLVAGALIGATARGEDRWSDIDLTFGVADGARIADVLVDWTARLEDEFSAVHLFDLSVMSTVYRVFLFPGNLQVDLSFTPGVEFGPLGPKFTLIFGGSVKRTQAPPPSSRHLFGLAVLYLLRARICIERQRLWEAEYLISGARDHILTLACIRRGLKTGYGKGFDDLPEETLKTFKDALIWSLDRAHLLHALGTNLDELLRNSDGVDDRASKLRTQLSDILKSKLS